MESNNYARIPVLKETKKRVDHVKIDTGCQTFDELINHLLDIREWRDKPLDTKQVILPSHSLYLHEQNERVYVSLDKLNWVDITDIIPK